MGQWVPTGSPTVEVGVAPTGTRFARLNASNYISLAVPAQQVRSVRIDAWVRAAAANATARVLVDALQADPAATYDATVLATSGLLGYWPLTDMSGTVADDAFGANNGTYVGGAALNFQPGLIDNDVGGAVDLDGVDDGVTTPLQPFVAGSIRTFEGWSRRDVQAGNDTLVGSSHASAGPWLTITGDPKFVWFPSRANSNDACTWEAFQHGVVVGELFHWALVWNDATRTAELFINGVSKGTRTTATSVYSATVTSLHIGKYLNSDFFDGLMGRVGVYSRALTAAELVAHYVVGNIILSTVDRQLAVTSSAWLPIGPFLAGIDARARLLRVGLTSTAALFVDFHGIEVRPI